MYFPAHADGEYTIEFSITPESKADLLVDRLEKAPDLQVADHFVFRVLQGKRNSFLNMVLVQRYFAAPEGWQPEPDSAVRVTHLPTGLVVTCQDEKSQLKNKTKALKVLRARLLDLVEREQQEKLARQRRSMVSTGDRSAKIRTYNFPQGRVTDHRIGLNFTNSMPSSVGT